MCYKGLGCVRFDMDTMVIICVYILVVLFGLGEIVWFNFMVDYYANYWYRWVCGTFCIVSFTYEFGIVRCCLYGYRVEFIIGVLVEVIGGVHKIKKDSILLTSPSIENSYHLVDILIIWQQ